VNKDERGRRWVVDIVPGGRNMGLFPVGRLDLDTTGLMILTNDGDLANRISHPRYGLKKEYHALVKGKWNLDDLKKRLENGIELENGDIVTNVKILSAVLEGERTKVILRIHEGRKHVVKRIFLAMGSRVYQLERTGIGELELSKIDPDAYIEVSKTEILELVFDQG
jgi:23S rRNA pseudouridine2605 synthase